MFEHTSVAWNSVTVSDFSNVECHNALQLYLEGMWLKLQPGRCLVWGSSRFFSFPAGKCWNVTPRRQNRCWVCPKITHKNNFNNKSNKWITKVFLKTASKWISVWLVWLGAVFKPVNSCHSHAPCTHWVCLLLQIIDWWRLGEQWALQTHTVVIRW
jgi:hypothetical protein